MADPAIFMMYSLPGIVTSVFKKVSAGKRQFLMEIKQI
jgi:hypothetical protein